MKPVLSTQVIVSGLIVLVAVLSTATAAVVSLRGGAAPPATTAAPAAVVQAVTAGGFARNYQQQPPLIPHSIAGFEITRENNQCLACHGPAAYKGTGAPKVADSHFRDRDGKVLDKVAGGRWFCNQCHVPQMDTPPLGHNDFRGEGAKP